MSTLFNNVATTSTTNFVPVQATFDAANNFLTFIGPGGVPFNTTSGGLTINTSTITGGTSGRVLYDNAGAVGELPVTGTGSVVLSDSPTLTGNVTANVNLRSGTLATLLPLAGGTSEIGYATDANALIRFNGTAGDAEVYGSYTNGYTKTFTITNANKADYTTGSLFIDCNHVSYLIIETAPDLVGFISNINIRLPLSTEISQLTVSIPNLINGINFPSSGALTFTTAYQTGEPFPSYFAIDADQGSTVGASIQLASCLTIDVKFVSVAAAWTRLPHIPSNEIGSVLSFTSNLTASPTSRGHSVKTNNLSNPPTEVLTTGVVANTGSITLDPGVWLITGGVEFTTSSTLVATELSAGIAQATSSASTSAVNIYDGGVFTQSNLEGGTLYRLSASPVLKEISTLPITFYQNAKAVFSAGTVSASVYAKAIRIA
jgi:hypothetical protein